MSKLFQLKRWLTVAQAAKHLSTIFGEKVSDVDIFRLALDYRLQLSAVFIEGVLASLCNPVDDADIQYKEVMSLSGTGTLKLAIGGQITYAPDGRSLQVQDKTFWLDTDEPYDLTMMGGEKADLERRYWQLAGGSVVDTTDLDGAFVSAGQGSNKRFFQLKGQLPSEKGEPRSFYPIGGLPDTAVFVVTPGALLALENSIAEKTPVQEKTLSTRERDTLLTIIAALAKAAKTDILDYGKSAQYISGLTDEIGANVSKRTIEEHLKKIPDALEVRMK
jgi:hypothetical protein